MKQYTVIKGYGDRSPMATFYDKLDAEIYARNLNRGAVYCEQTYYISERNSYREEKPDWIC